MSPEHKKALQIPMVAKRGFTVMELLIVITVVAVMTALLMPAATSAIKKARDVKRRTALNQIGRFMAANGCYAPNAGAGDYDIADLFDEVAVRYPQIRQMMSRPPHDPHGGTDTVTKYRYKTNADMSKCVLYANLEHEGEPVTLTGISEPTPGGGTGVLSSSTVGPNGTRLWIQGSN